MKAFLFQQRRDAHVRSMLRGRVGRLNIEDVISWRAGELHGATNRSVCLLSRRQRGLRETTSPSPHSLNIRLIRSVRDVRKNKSPRHFRARRYIAEYSFNPAKCSRATWREICCREDRIRKYSIVSESSYIVSLFFTLCAYSSTSNGACTMHNTVL